GLLLATPLTVCVAVIGRHLPELGYLNVLLGVDPVLSPEQRFYQRLLALDHEEAQDMIEQHAAAHGVAATFDEVMVPALTLAKLDRRKGALEPSRERYIYEHVRRELAGARIAVGVWAGADDVGASRERLLKLGVDDVCLHIAEAPRLVRQLAAGAPAAKAERPRRSAPR